ncbi:intraflagellar transport protein 81 [Kipferlia bialata]|uniref:Intraflagellar transport protein 81 n=1 Tax=Kipferlia bialata TaxID=797122 RepID=A0A9K3CPV1_9EUKA|nr:intraflagellar transport protein 81 [Kipferlia bialata]|eukprot:g1264.t1
MSSAPTQPEQDEQLIQFLVDALNAAPFNRQVSIFSLLDLRTPASAVQLLNDVLAEIQPDIKADVSTGIEEALIPMIELLLVLKYQPTNMTGQDLINRLKDGDLHTVFDVLYFLLSRLDHCKQRAYLYRFLGPVDIALEHRGDTVVRDLSLQLKELQDEFKAIHSEYTQAKKNTPDTNALAADIRRLTQLAQQLQFRQAETEASLKGRAGAAKVVPECLRYAARARENEEKADDLRKRIAALRVGANSDAARLEILSQRAEGDADATGRELMGIAKRDNEAVTRNVEDTLPVLIAQKRRLLQLCNGPTPKEGAIQTMKCQVEDKRAELTQLTQKRASLAVLHQPQAAQQDDASQGTDFLRKQVASLAQTQARLQAKRDDYAKRIADDEAKLVAKCQSPQDLEEAVASGDAVVSETAFKNCVSIARRTQPLFRQTRQRVQTSRKEAIVLQRTVDILTGLAQQEGQDMALEGEGEGVDVDGMVDRQQASEMRTLLADLQNTLQRKRQDLAPKVAALKEQHAVVAQLEAEFQALQTKAQALEAGDQGRAYQMKRKVARVSRDVEDLRSEIHRLECVAHVTRARLEAAQSGRQVSRQRKELTAEISKRENEGRDLKAQQRRLKADLPRLSAQKRQFEDLQQLLGGRMMAAQERQREAEEERAAEMDRFTSGANQAESNRLVVPLS